MPDTTITSITTQIGELTTTSYVIGAAIISLALAAVTIKVLRRVINKA